MKNNLIIAAKLTLICFIAVVLLSTINLLTRGRITDNKRIKEEKANMELFPEGTPGEKIVFPFVLEKYQSKYYYFKVYNSAGELMGYSVASVGKGYGGDMSVMVALSPRLAILDVKLLTNAETPGIGKSAEKAVYMEKFKNTNTNEKPFPMKKSMLRAEDQDAITGATITFNGLVGAIDLAIKIMQKELEGGSHE